ncbi:Abi family protein [Bifidobacterium sp. ESL0763]|uniref:Abi family protein n=1 Tax=Bifidobacterium sp. ESL0763 TaxID=2983227 RepID=UPI0023F7DEBD|nr:Abi family protein [Bifidobacterium sp. ESL0763]MDF7663854.1 Abi family protein [Bifidobacterium sp. ESL0763]
MTEVNGDDCDRLDDIDKPIIDVDAQIEVLRSHGVAFRRCSVESAKEFLKYHTYFFKLKAFDKEFHKNARGIYDNLDFADLKELSTLDYQIRRFVLMRSGEIEHAMKTRFNLLLMGTAMDGYELTEAFEASEKHFYRIRFHTPFSLHNAMNKNGYNQWMIEKYSSHIPPWVVWETCPFYLNIAFYRYFLKKSRYNDIIFTTLDGVRHLRNAAAHHNCLLVPTSQSVNPTEQLTPLLVDLFKSSSIDTDSIMALAKSDPLIHDFACLICTDLNLIQDAAHYSLISDSANLLRRLSSVFSRYQAENHLRQQLEAMIALLTISNNLDPSISYSTMRQPIRKQGRRLIKRKDNTHA